LSELIARLNGETDRDPAERQTAVAAARATAPRVPRRVFVGKQFEGGQRLVADAEGRQRLTR